MTQLDEVMAAVLQLRTEIEERRADLDRQIDQAMDVRELRTLVDVLRRAINGLDVRKCAEHSEQLARIVKTLARAEGRSAAWQAGWAAVGGAVSAAVAIGGLLLALYGRGSL